MKNVCDYCDKQKNRKPESWLCVKYGIVLHQPRIYCVSKEDKKPCTKGNATTAAGCSDPSNAMRSETGNTAFVAKSANGNG